MISVKVSWHVLFLNKFILRSMLLTAFLWLTSVPEAIGQVVTFELELVDLKGRVLSSTPIPADSPLAGRRQSAEREDVEVFAVLLVNDGRRNAYSVGSPPNLAGVASKVSSGGAVTVTANVAGVGATDDAFIALVCRRHRIPQAPFTALTSFMAVPRDVNNRPIAVTNRLVVAVPEPTAPSCTPCYTAPSCKPCYLRRCWARRCR